MAPGANGVQLRSLLDELWHRPTERNILVEEFVAGLNDLDWLILAAWDTAATFGPPSGKLDLLPPATIHIMDSWGKLFLVFSLIKANKFSHQDCSITYSNTDFCVIVDEASPSIPSTQFSHDPKSLLVALELIRNRLDDALLFPPELRNARIAQLAASSELEDDHFRKLALWYPVIEIYL